MLESLGEIPWQICSDIIIIIIQILNREWHEFTNWSHIYMMMHHVELSQFTLHQISLLSWQWRYGIYDYVLLPFHLMVDMFYFTHSDKLFSSCILICRLFSLKGCWIETLCLSINKLRLWSDRCWCSKKRPTQCDQFTWCCGPLQVHTWQ